MADTPILKWLFDLTLKWRNQDSINNDISINYQKSKYIGVIYSVSNNYEDQIINNLMTKFINDNKKVYTLEFLSKISPQDYKLKEKNHSFIRINDFNLLGMPKKLITKKFTEIEYDILINLTLNCPAQLHFLAAITRAKLKAGFLSKDYGFIYNFMFNPKEVTDFYKLIQNFESYIKKINKN